MDGRDQFYKDLGVELSVNSEDVRTRSGVRRRNEQFLRSIH